MSPTQHISNNDVHAAPKGVDIDACRPLPITRGVFPDGMPDVRSFWRPTAEEREAIAAGGLICLSIVGHTHTPVFLEAEIL